MLKGVHPVLKGASRGPLVVTNSMNADGERDDPAGASSGGTAGASSGGAAASVSAGVADLRPASAAAPARAAVDADTLLCGSPREVLARIVPGDPLAIRDVVADVLRSQCFFLDADRVHLRALARTARAALRYRSSGLELRTWLVAQASDAVAEILAEDLDTPRVDPGSAFAQFARPLGLDPEVMRRGCVAFNRLPIEDRAAFFALVVEDVGLEAHARASGATTNEVGRRARRGLEAVARANHPDLPPLTRTAGPSAPSARTTSARSTDSRPTVRPVSIPPTAGSASARIVHREKPR